MAIVLSDNIQVNAPKPIDSRYLNITVPYTSCSQVNTCLVAGVRFTGLTVNILGVEYWYNCGIADSCLVTKTAGSAGVSLGWSNFANGSTVIGCCTVPSGTTYDCNTVYGVEAGRFTTTGCRNIMIGYQAMRVSTTGSASVAIGYQALIGNTCGESNVAIGRAAMGTNTCGSGNVSVGAGSLLTVADSFFNVAIGSESLGNGNFVKCDNVAVGYATLLSSNGGCNVAIGSCAGFSQVSGCSSVFIGAFAGLLETTGCKLYIANSGTVNPLIYGEFDNQLIKINGDLVVTGNTTTSSIKLTSVVAKTSEVSIAYFKSDGTILSGTSISTNTITGATNGLSVTGKNIKLGGILLSGTTICGAQLLTLGDLNGITLSTANDTDIGLNAKFCGSIYIKSQTGTCPTGNDFCNAVGISASVCAIGGFAIYDNRTGTTQTGIVYANDYSTNYVARSLTDKAYVDSVAAGLNVHQAVRLATTSAITLSGNQSIDGVPTVTDYRVLVKNQGIGTTGSSFNGIYIASAGPWSRATDYDNSPPGEVSNGDLIPVTSGNTQSNSLWALVTPNPITVGVTPLIFTEFSRTTGVIAGNGICVTQMGGNNIVSVQLSPGASGLCFDGTGLELDFTTFTSGLTSISGKVNVNASQSAISGVEIPVKFNATCFLVVDSCNVGTLSEFTITGNSSSTGFTITHNKNKTFVDVQVVKNTAPYPTIYTYVSRPTANTVCVTFDIAPTTGQQYKILITS
jgi:hypothetical protein